VTLAPFLAGVAGAALTAPSVEEPNELYLSRASELPTPVPVLFVRESRAHTIPRVHRHPHLSLSLWTERPLIRCELPMLSPFPTSWHPRQVVIEIFCDRLFDPVGLIILGLEFELYELRALL
jgi:hypothetical protein